MNLPNRLTLLRIVLVPVFMTFLLIPAGRWRLLAALACFAVASLTDLIDGKLARRSNQVTNFGKLMDPLADKLLVSAALVVFVQLGLTNAWIAMIVIAREFLVTSLRLVAAGNGTVLAANYWGKVKTASQMIAVCVVLALGGLGLPALAGSVLLWIAAALTVVSGIQYVMAYRGYINPGR